MPINETTTGKELLKYLQGWAEQARDICLANETDDPNDGYVDIHQLLDGIILGIETVVSEQ